MNYNYYYVIHVPSRLLSRAFTRATLILPSQFLTLSSHPAGRLPTQHFSLTSPFDSLLITYCTCETNHNSLLHYTLPQAHSSFILLWEICIESLEVLVICLQCMCIMFSDLRFFFFLNLFFFFFLQAWLLMPNGMWQSFRMSMVTTLCGWIVEISRRCKIRTLKARSWGKARRSKHGSQPSCLSQTRILKRLWKPSKDHGGRTVFGLRLVLQYYSPQEGGIPNWSLIWSSINETISSSEKRFG